MSEQRGYWVREFPSATGDLWFQVMSPLGARVYESRDRTRAHARRDALNQQIGFA